MANKNIFFKKLVNSQIAGLSFAKVYKAFKEPMFVHKINCNFASFSTTTPLV